MLIISPYFPPVNTADMQRVRLSLPYFAENGWQAEVVAVDPQYVDLSKDELLLESVPDDTPIHYVKAFRKNITSKFGFGSIAYRSILQINREVVRLLRSERFDLVYFSTTQFQVCILGARWKQKFGIPYVIDMQDPWHSEYYRDKPMAQQPPKYRFSYLLNKYLEPIAIKKVSGIISVSADYIRALKTRYPIIQNVPSAVVTFGAFKPDIEIAARHHEGFKCLLDRAATNVVYIGRGGMDLHKAIAPLFEAVKRGVTFDDRFSRLKFYFIGTSYAPEGSGKETILPLAQQFGIAPQVAEITRRVGYYHVLATLRQADALFIPGSDDPQYTASKIYPYLLTKKPLLAVFNSASSAIDILREFGATHVYSYNETPGLIDRIQQFFVDLFEGNAAPQSYSTFATEKYSARIMTRQQCELFNSVIFTAG